MIFVHGERMTTDAGRWRRRICLLIAGGLGVAAALVGVRIGQLEADRDGDGIPDCREEAGIHLSGASAVTRLDPSDADTDSDGVPDGSEIDLRPPPTGFKDQVSDFWSCQSLTYVAWSDPSAIDADHDGLDDAVELSEGTDPFVADADRDELDDAQERELGSDPSVADTDRDGDLDGAEAADGFSSIIFDEPIDEEEWYAEYARGIGLGELDDIDSVPQLLGALSGGLSGSVPVVGWVVSTLGDIRDVIAGFLDGNWSTVLTSTAGVLPFAGDSAKAAKQITKFVEKNPEQVRRLVQGILSLEKVPEPARMTLLRAADPDGVDGLREWNVSDEVIEKFAKRGTALASLVAAAATTSELIQMIPSTNSDDDGFARSTADAEAALRQYVTEVAEPDAVTDGPVYIDGLPVPAYVGGRLIDACTDCGGDPEPGRSTLRIAKLGSLHYSAAVQSQVDKDAYLRTQGFDLEWHFFAGPAGWAVDRAVLDALSESDIPFFLHSPV
ncbi:MAG: hypothetical protein WBP61_02400 [Nocardioides sp.]